MRPFVADTSLLVDQALRAGNDVLFEGAQGTLLDLDHGTYPFVTSSNPIASGASTGIGIGPTRIDRVLGVAKAYVTRVGEGPLPSEIEGADQARVQELGGEFGTVTGRVRRCGWLDLVALRYAVRDARSLQVTSRLTLTSGAGAVVKDWSWGYRTPPPGSSLWSTRFRCTLAKGAYVIGVTGKDLAGNAQSVTGSATLLVR